MTKLEIFNALESVQAGDIVQNVIGDIPPVLVTDYPEDKDVFSGVELSTGVVKTTLTKQNWEKVKKGTVVKLTQE